jgi:hypothetical protein
MDQSAEDLIRNRAHDCCEYCRMPQEFDDLPFQNDHIIAKVHGGSDAPENRARACVPCNLYKARIYRALIRKPARLFVSSTRAGSIGNGTSDGMAPCSRARRFLVEPRFGHSVSTCQSASPFVSP